MCDCADNTAVADEPSTRPRTVSEVKEAAPQSMTSRAHTIFAAVFDECTKVAELIQPALKGTPFEAPIDIFLAIAEVIDVRADRMCVVDRMSDDSTERWRKQRGNGALDEQNFAKAGNHQSQSSCGRLRKYRHVLQEH